MSDIQKFLKGDVLMTEGSEGSLAYIIASGSVEVYRTAKGKKVVFDTLGPGNIVGEMSLITGWPRRATVAALEDTVVFAVNRDTFESAILENPETIIPLLKQVFRRLSDMDQMIMAFHEKAGSGGEAAPANVLQLRAATKESEAALGSGVIRITKVPFYIGRASRQSVFESRDLSLHDREPYQISRNHCAIVFNHQYYLVDSGSTMGTTVDGERIGKTAAKRSMPLPPGTHRVALGGRDSRYIFDLEVPASPE